MRGGRIDRIASWARLITCAFKRPFASHIERAGAEVLYLPPYSPDLNPIEKAWAKLKLLLRAAKARSKEALDQAIAEALKLISADNARAWFKHFWDGLQ